MAVRLVNEPMRGNEPAELPGETFLRRQSHVSASISMGSGHPGFNGSHSGKGTLFVSNRRLFFVRNEPTEDFGNVAIPFELLSDIRLGQPILGSTYIKGALNAGSYPGGVSFKFVFSRGGGPDMFNLAIVGTERQREVMRAGNYQPAADIAVDSAFFDPHNPNALVVSGGATQMRQRRPQEQGPERGTYATAPAPQQSPWSASAPVAPPTAYDPTAEYPQLYGESQGPPPPNYNY